MPIPKEPLPTEPHPHGAAAGPRPTSCEAPRATYGRSGGPTFRLTLRDRFTGEATFDETVTRGRLLILLPRCLARAADWGETILIAPTEDEVAGAYASGEEGGECDD